MIETLKPPTDSLYKFLAIIGLVIFLASVTSPIIINRQLNNQTAEFVRDAKANNLQAEAWMSTWKRVEEHSPKVQEVQQTLIEAKDSPDEKRVLQQAKNVAQRQEELIALFNKQLADWEKESFQVEYKQNLMEDTEIYARRIMGMCIIGVPVGLGLSIFGFVLWYRRAQRYEDLVLKSKVPEPKKLIITPDD